MAKAGSWSNTTREEGKDDGWITVHFGKGDLLSSWNSSDQGIQLQELEELTLQVLSNNKKSTSLPAPAASMSPTPLKQHLSSKSNLQGSSGGQR